MKLPIIERSELEAIDPKQAITALFSMKKRLLTVAFGNPEARQEIFDRRQEIVDLFLEFGGGRHGESAELFEGLSEPDDIVPHVKEPRRQRRRSKLHIPEQHRKFSGYYVYGERLNETQARRMKEYINSGRRGEDPIEVSLLQLFKLERYERSIGEPIYINAPLTPKLIKQMTVLLLMYPYLESSLFHMSWNEETRKPEVKPFTSLLPEPIRGDVPSDLPASVSRLTDGQIDAAFRMKEILHHYPIPGEVFQGRIERIVEFGMFVEILPDVVGLVHISNASEDRIKNLGDHFQEGDMVTVKVLENDGHYSRHLRLSVKDGEKAVREGEKPLFANTGIKLLGSGDFEW